MQDRSQDPTWTIGSHRHAQGSESVAAATGISQLRLAAKAILSFDLELTKTTLALVEFIDDTGSHSGNGEKFILHIYQDVNDRRIVGINLLNSCDTSLDKLDELLLDLREGDEPASRRDRATIRSPSGQVVIATLRKRAQDGELMYAVDFENRPLPTPMSHAELVNQFLEPNRMWLGS